MENGPATLNFKKIGLFFLLSCLQSWAAAALMYGFDIPYGSPKATIMTAAFFMSGPAVAAFVLQRNVYGDSPAEYGLRFSGFSWRWLLGGTSAIFLTFVALFLATVYVGGELLHIEGFGRLEFSEEALKQNFIRLTEGKIDLKDEALPFSPVALLVVSVFGGLLSGFTLNLPIMLGEEYGWRGLLFKETKPMGFIGSAVLTGFLWGVWHFPIILMGHNYPGFPAAGIGMMILFCIAAAFPFAYVRYKSKSIFAACAFHGMLNGTGGLLLFYINDGHILIANPAGVCGIIAFIILSILIILFDRNLLRAYPLPEIEPTLVEETDDDYPDEKNI